MTEMSSAAQRPPGPLGDRFANILAAEVVESAANTLTFSQQLTGISLGVRRGIIIDEIDYYLVPGSMGLLAGNADSITYGWTTSNDLTDLDDYSDRRVIHAGIMRRDDLGTAATGIIRYQPLVFQFFPPLILAAPSLYLAVNGASLAGACTLRSRIFFRFIDLGLQEYLELAEAFVLTG